ncbi:tonsoku-like protein [Amphiura filiformis]|uniref:tonsoku-like protein n=1 Tax=Amphiura filiformis TaxID=82378 RepID=UPI003B21AB4B
MNPHDKKEFKRLEKAKFKAQANGKLKEESELCNVLGELLARNGEYEDAIREHKQELQLSESLQDVIGSAVANRKIGECYSALEEYQTALRYQKRHLQLAQSVDNHVEEQRAFATIGRTYLCQGENSQGDKASEALNKAQQAFLKSLGVCDKLRGSISEKEVMEMRARLFLNLGLVFDNKQDFKNSAKFIKQAIFISEKHNLLEDLYRSQFAQGDIYQRCGEHSKGLRSLENAMQTAKKLKDKSKESETLACMANIYFQLCDFQAAKRVLKKAYKMGSQVMRDKDVIARHLRAAIKGCQLQRQLQELPDDAETETVSLFEALGDLCCKVSSFTKAVEYYKKQLKCALSLKKPSKELIVIYVSLAATYADNKQYEKAIQMYRKELELRAGNFKEEGKTWLNIADAQEKANYDSEAIQKSYSEALNCAKQAKHPQLQLRTLKSLSLVHQKYGQEHMYSAMKRKIRSLREDHDLASDDDDVSGEEDEGGEPNTEQSDSMDVDDDIILSESDDSAAEEEYDVPTASERVKRNKFAKRNEKGETLLHRACIDGNLKQVKRLIEQGHPRNPRDNCGWIPLHEACNFGFYEIAEFLLDHGADINDRGGEGCGGITPLHDAIDGGNFEVADLLINKGANVLAKNDEGKSAIDNLMRWKDTYERDIDEETMVRCRHTQGLLNKAITEGANRKIKPSRPRNIMEDPELFDKEEGYSQVQRSQGLSQRSTDMGRTTFTSKNRSISDLVTKKFSSNNQRTKQSLQPAQRRSSFIDLDTDEPSDSGRDATESFSSQESTSGSALSQDSMPDMVCHKRSRVQRLEVEVSTPEDESQESDEIHLGNSRGGVGSNGLNESSNIEDFEEEAEHQNNERSLDIDDPINARHSYRSAISRIGSAASRLSQQTFELPLTRSSSTNDGPAMISEEEYTAGDDWLIDDVGMQPTKRKRVDIDGTFSTSTSRSQVSKHFETRTNSSSSSRSRLSRKRKPRQTKLTSLVAQIGRIPSIIQEKDEEDISNTSSDVEMIPESPVESRVPDFPQRNNVSLSQQTQEQRPPAVVGGTVMRIKVKIQDKMFLIPIPTRDERSMNWLAEEAGRRYYNSCGLKPKLVLCTQEGAEFSPDDMVTDLLTNNEEVLGKVDQWDLPPLLERYKRACENAKTKEHPLIRGSIQLSQNTSTLTLANHALSSNHCTPLFLALQCQYSLKKLLLPGNRIGDSAISSLIGALGTLPNLSHLDLSGNEISQEGLKVFHEVLCGGRALEGQGVVARAGGGDNQKILQMLEELNLGYNPLSDACALYVSSLVKHCPLLAKLGLQSCDLSMKFFQLHRRALTEAFQGATNLHTIQVSHNALGSTGVELLLKCLSANAIVSLDLSCVIPTAVGNNLAKHMASYLGQSDCVLKELLLSGCHLSDEDCQDLARCIPFSKHLTALDLSANPKITAVGIAEVLNTFTRSSLPLEKFDVSGCGLKTPLSTDAMDAVAGILEKKAEGGQPALRELKMSGTELTKVDHEVLLNMWDVAHGDESQHNIDRIRCVLFTRD